VTRIRALLETRETRRLLEEDPVAELKASLVSELDEDDYYKILELNSVWIQNRVSPILKALTFQRRSWCAEISGRHRALQRERWRGR
jgi:hypothetical protein